MRNLVLLLLLANVIFFAWDRWVAEPPAGAAIRFRDADTGAELKPAVQPEAGLAEPSVAQAAVPRRCASIGPFEERGAAETALSRVAGLGYPAALRSGPGEVFLGHWVQIRNIPTREESRRLLGILQANGIEEAYPVPEDDGERTISLGLFSDLDRARRLERRGDGLGLDLDVEIVRHTREATLFWVDAAVPPGEDPGVLERAVGGTEVVIGDPAAECPPG